MPNVKLEVNLKTHWYLIWPVLVPIPFLVAAVLHVRDEYGLSQFNSAILIGLAIYLILFIPVLILHLYYSFLNKPLIIEQFGDDIVFSRNSTKTKHNIKDIVKIELSMPTSSYRNGFRMLPTENYFLGRIYWKNGDLSVITPLVDPELIWLKQLSPELTNTKIQFICI